MSKEKKSAATQVADEAKRRELNPNAAKQTIADSQAEPDFHTNRVRLRRERLAREAGVAPLVGPTPELPDDTPIERVMFPARIQSALKAADLKTVGEVREIPDETLINLPDFGRGSLSDLREKLGLPSTHGVRPLDKSRPA